MYSGMGIQVLYRCTLLYLYIDYDRFSVFCSPPSFVPFLFSAFHFFSPTNHNSTLFLNHKKPVGFAKTDSGSPGPNSHHQNHTRTVRVYKLECALTFWIRVRWPRVANVPGVTKGWWFRSSRNPGSNHPTPSKADHLHNSTVFSPPREYFFSSALGTSSTDAKVEWVRSMNMVLKRIATLSTYHRGIGQ